jgi:hypothetical protein
MRTALAIVLASAVAPLSYLAFHALASLSLSAPPTESVAVFLSFGAPVASMLLSGVVSGFVAGSRWPIASVACGIAGTLFFLWYFSASGYWLFFALTFAVGVPIAALGGFLGSRSPIHAPHAP